MPKNINAHEALQNLEGYENIRGSLQRHVFDYMVRRTLKELDNGGNRDLVMLLWKEAEDTLSYTPDTDEFNTWLIKNKACGKEISLYSYAKHFRSVEEELRAHALRNNPAANNGKASPNIQRLGLEWDPTFIVADQKKEQQARSHKTQQQFTNSTKPAPPPPEETAETPTVAPAPLSKPNPRALTANAQKLLATLTHSSGPLIWTKNLDRLARENGFERADKSPTEFIAYLKARQAETTQRGGASPETQMLPQAQHTKQQEHETSANAIAQAKACLTTDGWTPTQISDRSFAEVSEQLHSSKAGTQALFKLYESIDTNGIRHENLPRNSTLTKVEALLNERINQRYAETEPPPLAQPSVPPREPPPEPRGHGIKITPKEEAAGEKRLYLYHKNRLLATCEPEKPVPHIWLKSRDLKNRALTTLLNDRNQAGKTLRERIDDWLVSTGQEHIEWNEVEMSNTYGGLRDSSGTINADELLRVNLVGEGIEHIHERRDVLATIRDGHTPLRVDEATLIAQLYAAGATELKIEDGKLTHTGATPEQAQRGVGLDRGIVRDLIRFNAAGKVRWQYTVEGPQLERDPDHADHNSWTIEQITNFVGQAMRQASTAQEQIAYLEEFGRWCQRYETQAGARAMERPNELSALNKLAKTLDEPLIPTGDPAQDNLATARVTIAEVRSLVHPPGHHHEATTLAEILKNSNELRAWINHPDHLELARPQEETIEKEWESQSPTAQTASAKTRNPIPDAQVAAQVREQLFGHATDQEKLKLYRKHGHLLHEYDRVKLTRTTQNQVLLLALAEDPLSGTETRQALVDFAPGGPIGEIVQLTVLRESLLRAETTLDPNGKTTAPEIKSILDILKADARSTLVATVVKKLRTTDPTNPKDTPNYAQWQTTINTPDGIHDWNAFLHDTQQQLTTAEQKAGETEQITAHFLSRKIQRNANGTTTVHYRFKIKDYEIEAINHHTSETELKMGAMFAQGDPVAIVTRRDRKTSERLLLSLQPKEKLAAITNEEILPTRRHSELFEIDPITVGYMNDYIQYSAEILALKQMQTEAQEKGGVSALLTKADEIYGPKDMEGRRIGDQRGQIEWAIKETPENPFPGATATEQKQNKNADKKRWQDAHEHDIQGIRDGHKKLITGNDGQPIQKGYVQAIKEDIERLHVPAQVFDKVDPINLTCRGVICAETALATFRDKVDQDPAQLDAIDQKILLKNGGQLPRDIEDYLSLRITVLEAEKKAAITGVLENVKDSTAHTALKQKAGAETAKGTKKLFDLLMNALDLEMGAPSHSM